MMRTDLRYAGALAALMWLAACSTPAPAPAHRVLRSGGFDTGMRSAESPQVMVSQDADAYKALFGKIVSGQTPAPQPPSVDFTDDIVVYASLGEKPTAGYRIEIAEIRCKATTMRIRLNSTGPPADALAAQVVTQPYVLAAVRRCPSMRSVEFTGEDFAPARAVTLDQNAPGASRQEAR